MKTVTNFIFLGSKIPADCDYSHVIKNLFLLGKKTMTDLDSIYKKKPDITLLTKVPIVKAIIFPVVIECENWTIKKAEYLLYENRCFQNMVLEKTIESPLDCKEIKPVNPKGNQP